MVDSAAARAAGAAAQNRELHFGATRTPSASSSRSATSTATSSGPSRTPRRSTSCRAPSSRSSPWPILALRSRLWRRHRAIVEQLMAIEQQGHAPSSEPVAVQPREDGPQGRQVQARRAQDRRARRSAPPRRWKADADRRVLGPARVARRCSAAPASAATAQVTALASSAQHGFTSRRRRGGHAHALHGSTRAAGNSSLDRVAGNATAATSPPRSTPRGAPVFAAGRHRRRRPSGSCSRRARPARARDFTVDTSQLGRRPADEDALGAHRHGAQRRLHAQRRRGRAPRSPTSSRTRSPACG